MNQDTASIAGTAIASNNVTALETTMTKELEDISFLDTSVDVSLASGSGGNSSNNGGTTVTVCCCCCCC